MRKACSRDANQSDFIVFRTTNRAKYDNTILPIKIRFSPNVCLPLSLSLFFFLISYQTITLVWHFISLLSSGGNPTKIKSWRSILHYLPRSHFCCICSLYCTVLHALCSLWLYPVYIPYLFGSSPHRTAKQLFSCPYTQFCVSKNPCDF